MNQREKFLAYAAFSMVGLFLVGLVVSRMILSPAAQAKKNVEQLTVEVDDIRDRIDREPAYVRKLRLYAEKSYGDSEAQAKVNLREHLLALASRANLRNDSLRLQPLTGKKLRGGLEVGMTVNVTGSLDRLTNLLYLLENDPHLHKVENLNFSPVPNATDLNLQFKLATLVLDPHDGQSLPVEPDKLKNDLKLADEGRKQYALIEQRDVFRPYIKRPPRPEPRPTPPSNNNDRRDDPPPKPAPQPTFQVVGLPQFGAEPEVAIYEDLSRKTRYYQIGEDLRGGEIMAVDYRVMPKPRNRDLLSESRVILRYGREFYAVELGDKLDQRHKLSMRQLPQDLRELMEALTPKPAPQPAEATGEKSVETSASNESGSNEDAADDTDTNSEASKSNAAPSNAAPSHDAAGDADSTTPQPAPSTDAAAADSVNEDASSRTTGKSATAKEVQNAP